MKNSNRMTQPQLIGHEHLFNRDVFLTVLDEIDIKLQVPPTVGRFACLWVMNGRSTDDASLRQFCRALIRLGCAYLSCWGPDCERIHDLMDSEVEGDNPPESYVGCIMTTWHAQGQMEDAVDFFLTCTYPDEHYAPNGCTWGWAIAMGPDPWASELKQLLAAKVDKEI